MPCPHTSWLMPCWPLAPALALARPSVSCSRSPCLPLPSSVLVPPALDQACIHHLDAGGGQPTSRPGAHQPGSHHLRRDAQEPARRPLCPQKGAPGASCRPMTCCCTHMSHTNARNAPGLSRPLGRLLPAASAPRGVLGRRVTVCHTHAAGGSSNCCTLQHWLSSLAESKVVFFFCLVFGAGCLRSRGQCSISDVLQQRVIDARVWYL